MSMNISRSQKNIQSDTVTDKNFRKIGISESERHSPPARTITTKLSENYRVVPEHRDAAPSVKDAISHMFKKMNCYVIPRTAKEKCVHAGFLTFSGVVAVAESVSPIAFIAGYLIFAVGVTVLAGTPFRRNE